jgi:hypothetical protein
MARKYGALLIVFMTVHIPLYTGWHINWDLHFSKFNWTRTYATVACEDGSGVSQRIVYEERVRKFVDEPEFRQKIMQDSTKYEIEQLYLSCQELVNGYHAEIVDGYKQEHPRLLAASDHELLIKLELLLKDSEFVAAYNRCADNSRNVQRLEQNLAEIRDFTQPNISAIAETPKKTFVCFLLLGLAYYVIAYHSSELKEAVQEAKEGVQQGAHIAGNAIAHAMEKPKPDQKPETNPDEKKS